MAFAGSLLDESKARCWRIQVSRSMRSGFDFSRRTASRCSGVLPLTVRSISNSSSMRRTASAAIGASPAFARSKNFLRPWLQQAPSRIGAGFRLDL